MKHTLAWKLAAFAMALTLPALAHALTFDDLRPDAPPCKQTKAKRPKLYGDYEIMRKAPALMSELALRLDINGDEWCDYVLRWGADHHARIPSIEARDLDQLVILGNEKKWIRVPTNIKKVYEIYGTGSEEGEEYAIYNIDLSGINLIYPKAGGAPYVFGLDDGGLYHRCKFVYRWDNATGTFRRVDETIARVVRDFYFQRIDPQCRDREDSKTTPGCSGYTRLWCD